ncbi:DNA-3-methyladenine glycosylase I [Sphingomonadaceae bacterium OTU29THOMA1]|nr:DNA-3-methyladenine glycosylase I [Sphingomonadaceae bacterium OTU29THOMA1]
MTEGRRCVWAEDDPLLRKYHDEEWGVRELDSRRLWESLVLEGFQAGLSWLIVLRKRDAFRDAFARFAPEVVADFAPSDVERLLRNDGIIRSRAKIEATISSARIFCEMAGRGEDFSSFCWSFTGGATIRRNDDATITSSPLSTTMSKELKRRGFKFVGPTITYAWMQAVGIVDDHSRNCFRHREARNT